MPNNGTGRPANTVWLPYSSDFRMVKLMMYFSLHKLSYPEQFSHTLLQNSASDTEVYELTGQVNGKQWTIKAVNEGDSYTLSTEDAEGIKIVDKMHDFLPAGGSNARGFQVVARREHYEITDARFRALLAGFGITDYQLGEIISHNNELFITYFETGTLKTSSPSQELTAAFWQAFLDNCPEK